MNVTLDKLEFGTIFTYASRRWKKNGGCWVPPAELSIDKSIVGKACCTCSPEYGGMFQPQLDEWIPNETIVSIS